MGLKVGITGGIGSGKTTICRIFKALGVPVFDADQETKLLMQSDPALVSAIKKSFGSEAYDEQGVLDRAYLASLVFNNEEKLPFSIPICRPSAYPASNPSFLA